MKDSPYLAMKEILPETLSDTTNTTIVAMIDALVRIIVPKLANIAVIPSTSLPTHSACFRCRLRTATEHTEHILRFLTVQHVVLYSVMTEAAGVPSMACGAL